MLDIALRANKNQDFHTNHRRQGVANVTHIYDPDLYVIKKKKKRKNNTRK